MLIHTYQHFNVFPTYTIPSLPVTGDNPVTAAVEIVHDSTTNPISEKDLLEMFCIEALGERMDGYSEVFPVKTEILGWKAERSVIATRPAMLVRIHFNVVLASTEGLEALHEEMRWALWDISQHLEEGVAIWREEGGGAPDHGLGTVVPLRPASELWA